MKPSGHNTEEETQIWYRSTEAHLDEGSFEPGLLPRVAPNIISFN
jgi:hypothetical protein